MHVCTYDQTSDGQMDITFSFGEKELHATVYVKLVTLDQLYFYLKLYVIS